MSDPLKGRNKSSKDSSPKEKEKTKEKKAPGEKTPSPGPGEKKETTLSENKLLDLIEAGPSNPDYNQSEPKNLSDKQKKFMENIYRRGRSEGEAGTVAEVRRVGDLMAIIAQQLAGQKATDADIPVPVAPVQARGVKRY